MLMYEKVYQTISYKIIIYTTRNNFSLLTIDECIKVVGDLKLSLPQPFVFKDEKIFCSKKIFYTKSYLKILKIEKTSTKSKENIFDILKMTLPTIFNIKKVDEINRQYLLYSNRNLIIESAISVLGKNEVENLNLWNKINWYYKETTYNDQTEDLIVEDIFNF